jgi:putative tryptophan/tyrosine transport system substrate-binding protein
MRRREFITLVGGAAAWPVAAHAQQAGKVYRVGYLASGAQEPSLLEVLRQRLRELGWIEGRNIEFEYRFAEGKYDRLPALAAELIGRNVDLIAASPTPAALAARNATQAVPIVGISFDNPVQLGLVASLARPGGNVTGISYGDGPDIFGKDLELLREVVPNAQRVAVLSNSAGPSHAIMMGNLQKAAQSLGMELLPFDAHAADDFDTAFTAMTQKRVDALFVFGDVLFGVHRARLAELAVRHRLPAIYTNRLHVDAGGLMCYAASFPDIWRRAATYVDKILRGAKPADLPVEQPNKYELTINLKAAKAIGLTIPPTLLTRADNVIE